MKRLSVVLVVSGLLLLLIPAYGVANAKSSNPQNQVKSFMSAAAGLKVSKVAGYWVTEEASNVTDQLASVSAGTKISLSKLKLVVASQTADKAEVTATYSLKVQLKGQKKAQQSNLNDTFNLKLVNGTWLISGTTMWDHWAGLVTTSTQTATPIATAPATTTGTPTPTTSGNPVKIGVETVWSGPLASAGYLGDQVLAMVNNKVKDMGGLLGGRELKILKFDTGGTVAGATAGATKLVKEDNVCALAWGGASAADINAIASAAEDLKVLYAPFNSPAPGRLENELHYTVLPAPPSTANYVNKANLIIDKLKAKTIAFLYSDDADTSKQIDLVTKMTEPAGIKTVYQGLVSSDAVDMTSYLTKIKYVNPDVLILGLYTPQAMTAAKQIMELGGWGNIQVLGISGSDTAAKLQGSWGWIIETAWAGPSSTYPASVQFVEDFKAANGDKEPNINHMWFYASLWTVIEAIKQAGTDDRATLAQFARSGNLQWDTPMGMAHFTPDGNSGLDFSYIRILQGGKIAPYE